MRSETIKSIHLRWKKNCRYQSHIIL